MFAFAGIVALHRQKEWRLQRFRAFIKDAEAKRIKLSLANEEPDEGLIGI